MVKGWLKSGMDKDTRTSVRYANTAQGMWKDLEERFAKGNAPRAYGLKRSIALLRQENLSVPTYYTKLKTLWDEAQAISPMPRCTCTGCKCDIQKNLTQLREREQLYDFLMGLDNVFNIVKTQILSMASNLTLGQAYHFVAEDEQQRIISSVHKPSLENVAFQAQGVCGTREDQKGAKKAVLKCDHCGKIGHTQQGCFEIIGYPDWWKPNKDRKEKPPFSSKKLGFKAAQVNTDSNPIPGLNMRQYDRLIQQLKIDEGGT